MSRCGAGSDILMAMARQDVCAVVIRTIRAENTTRPDAISRQKSEPAVRADDEGALELRNRGISDQWSAHHWKSISRESEAGAADAATLLVALLFAERG